MNFPQWDFVLTTPAEARERRVALESADAGLALKRLAFRCFLGGGNDNTDIAIFLDRVSPLTTDQGFNEWHILRRFSLTSSTTHESILAAAQYIRSSHSCRGDFEAVLRMVDKDQILPAEGESGCADGDDDDASSGRSNEEEDLLLSNLEREAKTVFNKMLDPTTALTYYDELDMSNGLRRALASLVPGINVSASTKDSTIKKNLDAWASQPVSVRSFRCQKKSVIVEKAAKLGIATPHTKSINILLQEINTKIFEQQAASTDNSEDEAHVVDNARTKILSTMLSRWFLKPLSGKAKEWCRLGHDAEGLLVSNLAATFKDWTHLTDLEIVLNKVYTAGLVESNDIPGLCASADALLLCSYLESPAQQFVIPLECKARVTAKTQVEATQKLESALVKHNRSLSQSGIYLLRTSSADDLCFLQDLASGAKWKELLQILHLVVCYRANIGALTVGTEDGTPFYTVFIQFDDDILNCYANVVTFLKTTALGWAYSATEAAPWEEIEAIIKSKTKPHFGLSDVRTQFSIWKQLRDGTGDILLPIHRCSRIIPVQHAHWNVLKGVSDTTTKLFDQRELKLANRSKSPSVQACGRTILAFVVLVHRMDQVFSAKRDFTKYPTLAHFRNAATKRRTFSSTLDATVAFLKRTANIDEASKRVLFDDGMGPTTVKGQRRTHRHKPASVTMAAPKTGFTPKKHKLRIPEEVIRANECPGKFVSVLEQSKDRKTYKDKRLTCETCRSRTKWLCVLCRRWFCYDNQITSGNIERAPAKKKWASHYWGDSDLPEAYCREVASTTLYNAKSGESETILFKNSCGLFAHQKQATNLINDMQKRIHKILDDSDEDK